MTVQQKDAIAAMRAGGSSYTQIAGALGLSVNTVKSHVRRADEQPVDILPEGHRRCLNCATVFTQPKGRKAKRFCSQACRLSWWHKNPGMSSRAEQIICPGCQRPFMTLPGQKHCSHACYVDYRFRSGGHSDAN